MALQAPTLTRAAACVPPQMAPESREDAAGDAADAEDALDEGETAKVIAGHLLRSELRCDVFLLFIRLF